MKRFLVCLLAVSMLVSGAFAANVDIDGVSFGGAKLINSVTYVPFRAFCEELSDGKISWNGESSTATLEGEGTSLSAGLGDMYIQCNGRYVYSGNKNLIIDGSMFVPVRSIAKALDSVVEWNGTSRTAVVTSGAEVFKNADAFYDGNELYWLSKIISAESAGEPLVGKIAVGNVVLNRVASSEFPDNIYDVIFDTSGGVQFTPVANGTINNPPTEESIMAAKICLENYKVTDANTLFFLNPSISTSMWIPNNRDFVMSVGKHDFYA
ncbi:MAG: cell wall hydrolase [Oscillospiraceae bacterium]|nr:cell wall hydrolase [Oscillospiraceae bacterium]